MVNTNSRIKNKLLIISLMILPVILWMLEIIFKHAKGEYFLYDNYDGPYGYLMASLNIAQLHRPGYFQHPGIIPQLIMAGVIKMSHLLQGNDQRLAFDVFNRPEFYLQHINVILTLINVVALFIVGY